MRRAPLTSMKISRLSASVPIWKMRFWYPVQATMCTYGILNMMPVPSEKRKRAGSLTYMSLGLLLSLEDIRAILSRQMRHQYFHLIIGPSFKKAFCSLPSLHNSQRPMSRLWQHAVWDSLTTVWPRTTPCSFW
ncbi:hypothetical protein EGW08_000325, partial [Elysia chlorotica]